MIAELVGQMTVGGMERAEIGHPGDSVQVSRLQEEMRGPERPQTRKER